MKHEFEASAIFYFHMEPCVVFSYSIMCAFSLHKCILPCIRCLNNGLTTCTMILCLAVYEKMSVAFTFHIFSAIWLSLSFPASKCLTLHFSLSCFFSLFPSRQIRGAAFLSALWFSDSKCSCKSMWNVSHFIHGLSLSLLNTQTQKPSSRSCITQHVLSQTRPMDKLRTSMKILKPDICLQKKLSFPKPNWQCSVSVMFSMRLPLWDCGNWADLQEGERVRTSLTAIGRSCTFSVLVGQGLYCPFTHSAKRAGPPPK